VRPRATNNLGVIALRAGDPVRADELFAEAVREQSPRRWLVFLNAATSPARSSERLNVVRELVKQNKNDGRPPAILSMWLAAVSPDPKEAAESAKEALEELATPIYVLKPDGSQHGLESEGSFQVGLGIASKRRYHELGSYAYGNLWLMPPLPLTRAELEAKAKAAQPTKPPVTKKDEKPKAQPSPKK
jgi:hypothetical protein